MADWGSGMSAGCKPWVQLFIFVISGWPRSALQYHWLMPISCHFQDCKALLSTSPSHVGCAIASTGLYFTFTLPKIVGLLSKLI